MGRARILTQLVAALAISAAGPKSLAAAQDASGDVEALLQRGLDAIGGPDNLSAIQTVSYVGGRQVKPLIEF